MPAYGFTKPGSADGGALSFEDAPEWYDENTEIPSEAIRIIAASEGDPRRRSTNLSPSSCGERGTCLRQLALKKFIPYLIDGCSEWQATEGTIYHEAFENAAPEDDPWHREVELPKFLKTVDEARFDELVAAGMIREKATSGWEMQVLDGIWMSGRVDKLKKDLTEIQDFKTKAWPGWKDRKTGAHKVRHYPPSDDVKIQLNLYGLMVAKLFDVEVPGLVIRQVYKGTRIAKETFKRHELDVIPEGELDLMIRGFVEKAVEQFEHLRRIELDCDVRGVDPVPEILEEINKMEMTGQVKNMFNGTKCALYCTQMPICFELAGNVRFDTDPSECRVIKPEEIK